LSEAIRTDGQLLAEFISRGSEAPFEALVGRHGRLVLGVCRRVLGEHAEAEDAAQAVFLTLAHKAKSLRSHPSLAGWLHRVARHVALRARESRDLRRRREGEAGEMVKKIGTVPREGPRSEQLLDGELDALPKKYRQALILRYMEGLSEEESAAALGVRTGTLSARLTRGRELLKQKLTRRGTALSISALAGLLAASGKIQLPAAFATGTAKAAALALAGQAAAAGAVAANVALLTKGALNAMFWAKMKVAAAVLGTAAVVSAGVPAAVHAVKAAEKPQPIRETSASPKKKLPVRPLTWKEIGSQFLYRQLRPKGKGRNRYFQAWWDQDSYDRGWEFYGDAVEKKPTPPVIDFRSKMAVYWRPVQDVFLRVEKVVESNEVIGVHYAARKQLPHEDRLRDSGRLLEVERREKPVVFYENGKEVARVPFAAKKDKELEAFLPHVRNAQALARVKYKEQLEGGPGFTAMAATQIRRLYGQRPKADGNWKPLPGGRSDQICVPNALMDRQARPGDELLVAWNAKDGPAAIKWAPAREQAVKFALAPGFRGGMCPWCFGKPVTDDKGQCRVCGEQFTTGSQTLCGTCAILRGQCGYRGCSRTVGPATRGVELKLTFTDPRMAGRGGGRRTPRGAGATATALSLSAGKAPSLWLSIDSKAKSVREVMTFGGGGLLLRCRTIFFLVEGPGAKTPACVFHSIPPDLAARVAPMPLKKSASASLMLKPKDVHARPVFAKPGTYTVRAVAGRLVSNPLIVVVKKRAGTAAAGPAPVARPRPVPAAGGPGFAPKWRPGGNSVTAVHAASGKTIWTARMRFAIGNVMDNGKTWLVTSRDGAQQVTLDAKSGKTIRRERLKPAAGGGEVF
jgi:RNA polymerase sigma factor (sigma-70 family)